MSRPIKFEFSLEEFETVLRLVRWELEDSQWSPDLELVESLFSRLKDTREGVSK